MRLCSVLSAAAALSFSDQGLPGVLSIERDSEGQESGPLRKLK